MLHVHGSGDDVLAPTFRLAGELGGRVLDCTAGDLISSPDETSGWHAFQEFRDRVAGAERWPPWPCSGSPAVPGD
jgi:hypothetical protein